MSDSPANPAQLVAIIGMAGRFPGARNVDEFWRNLRDGVESITPLDDARLRAAGVSGAELANPDYVRAAALLEDFDHFDAAFFGLSPKDAAIMDPQHRLFLEAAWEALEDAGWTPDEFAGRVGIYAGSGMNSYLIHNLLTNPALLAETGIFLLKQTGNDKDVLATRVSYHLNLTGPSLAVQTACSTSLVAIHLAAQSLLNHECDMALAGGVTIEVPHGRGYIYREREILARDGHCRAFDAAASGTVFGSGLGLVVLRRLEDALRDGDRVRAVIRGTAINNDGARKVGYLAPSVAGQAEAIAEALAVADLPADSISYIEAHGTGTAVGDPIELAALTQVFRAATPRQGFCAIGSVKTNIGHLDAAAGVTGLIKTVLALEHRQLPPSLNFVTPNPLIDFASSPFFVNTRLRDWPGGDAPRRAGVTALGIGGTNAHVILEDAPAAAPPAAGRPWQLLTLSAKTPTALATLSGKLAEHLADTGINLADAAYTCHFGRKALRLRRAVVCRDTADAIRALGERDPAGAGEAAPELEPEIIFLFPGQGAQYPAMGRELYRDEPEFRATVDYCAAALRPLLGLDLREVLFPADAQFDQAARLLDETRLTQPALFVIEFAMAKLLEAWGIKPAAMMGHSIGEFAAACLAGVVGLDDALHIVAERGRLMQGLPGGAMTAVPLPLDHVTPLLGERLSIASINAAEQCVVAGPVDAIDDLEAALGGAASCRRLRVSHAFHSAMMDEMVPAFRAFLGNFTFAAPRVPIVSSATGAALSATEACDPDYWSRQSRQTVRFHDGATALLERAGAVLLEVGPGSTLGTLMLRHPGFRPEHRVVASMRTRQDLQAARGSDLAIALQALAQLWTAGCKIDWRGFHAHETRRRVALPTYPFERKRFWIEPGQPLAAPAPEAVGTTAPQMTADSPGAIGLFQPVWKTAELKAAPGAHANGPWLVFSDPCGLGARLCEILRTRGARCYEVVAGSRFARLEAGRFVLDPARREDYDELFAALGNESEPPRAIVHLWSIAAFADAAPDLIATDPYTTMSFDSLLYLSQALATADSRSAIDIGVVANSLVQLPGESAILPQRAVLAGPCAVAPKELPHLRLRQIDIRLPEPAHSHNGAGTARLTELATTLIDELRNASGETPVAYRDQRRWVRSFEPLLANRPVLAPISLRDRGVYLITGGLGGIGLTLAASLARSVRARLVLLGRTAVPPRASWDEWLAEHDPADPRARKLSQLRDLERAGAEILVLAADVTDAAALRQALVQARAAFGPLNGVIHCAGVLDDAPLLRKNAASAARVLAPKVTGTLALEAALAEEPLDFLLLMSSVSSVLGPAGQVDYTAANAFLDAFAQARSGRRGYPVIAIAWPRWRDVGMAATFPTPSANRRIHPLLAERLTVDVATTIYSTSLNGQTDWIVSEHQLKHGPALFPGSGYIEMISAALGATATGQALTISNLYFMAPLAVDSSTPRPLRLNVRSAGNGYRITALAPAGGQSGEWLEYAQGDASCGRSLPASALDLEAVRRRCTLRVFEFDGEHQNRVQERYIAFGPRWRSLQRLELGRDEALAVLELPRAFHADLASYRVHPALLDMATGAATYLIPGYLSRGHLYVPASYGSITLIDALPAKCYSHIVFKRAASSDYSLAAFDITITDERGQVVVQIADFLLREVPEPAALAAGTATHRSAAHVAEIELASLAAGTASIDAAEGAAALQRVLANPAPNVVVFPTDFGAAVVHAQPVQTRSRDTSASTIRAAAANEVEATLLEWLRELLGIERAARDDDFFALGGQSLTAVRLLAKVKKTYGVDLDLAVLFKAPTVAKLASLIRHDPAPEATYRSIVPIRTSGTTPPLFLIHALGGRVIGYGDLARQLPAAQVVYGVEFALPDANAAHFRMEYLAANYLTEMRRVQPFGPYYLLGFSFGGLLAFEMAQQLHKAGQEVAFLGMLDTWQTSHIRSLESTMSPPRRMLQRIELLMRHARSDVFSSAELLPILRKLSRRGGQFVTDLIGSGRRAAYAVFERINTPVPKTLQFSNDINWFAVQRYRFRPYPGRLTLFRATGGMGSLDDRYGEDLGWGGLAQGGVEVHEVTSDHLGILREPGVRILAAEIAGCLDRLRRPGTSTTAETAGGPHANVSASQDH